MAERLSARQRGYTTQWDKEAKAFKCRHPLCVMCLAEGHISAVYAVDHIRPHKGNMELFWDQTNWQSLCRQHHNADKQAIEKGGKPKQAIGIDGWPINSER